jgi:protocatechuate 3,4-dioxygenase, beta subunit
MNILTSSSRRRFLGTSALGIVLMTQRGLFAEELARTVELTEGPFYPDRLPLDTDNDLLVINDGITPAVGEITYLGGKVLTNSGSPVRNALVEIWQVDHNGAYLHTGSSNRDKADKNFQGYGRFLTDSEGRYFFRTVKPVAYPGRTPHIHFAISRGEKRVLTTQLLIEGESQNERDGVFRNVRDEQARKTLLAAFNPVADSKIGELAANWNIVLGVTPADKEG